jgi:hypothetical protein
MPHYVNIALEDYFLAMSFCLQGQRGSLIPPQAWAMCRMCIGAKSMTKNKPEGQGSGAATKNVGANGRFLRAAGINYLPSF